MIARVAGERLAKVCLELGGKNPLVVCDDADLEGAAEAAALSALLATPASAARRAAGSSSSTRSTTSSSALLLERTERPARRARATSDDFGPVINERQLEHMLAAVASAREARARRSSPAASA